MLPDGQLTAMTSGVRHSDELIDCSCDKKLPGTLIAHRHSQAHREDEEDEFTCSRKEEEQEKREKDLLACYILTGWAGRQVGV